MAINTFVLKFYTNISMFLMTKNSLYAKLHFVYFFLIIRVPPTLDYYLWPKVYGVHWEKSYRIKQK